MQRSEQTFLETPRPQLSLSWPCCLHPACKGDAATPDTSDAVAAAEASAAHAAASVSPRQNFLGAAKLCTLTAAWFPSFSLWGVILAKVFTSNLLMTLLSTCSFANCCLTWLGTKFIWSARYVASLGWVQQKKRGNFNPEFISTYSFSVSFTRPLLVIFSYVPTQKLKLHGGILNRSEVEQAQNSGGRVHI